MSPLALPIRRPRPLFDAQTDRCAVRLQVGRIYHLGLIFVVLSGQSSNHPGEDALSLQRFQRL